jgi:uncharacterized SAM-binding protein YcdF (DUF218 family)
MVFAFILLIIVYLLFTFIQVYYYARHDDVGSHTRVDAIVVLGAAQYNGRPSAVLKARLDHALELYQQKVAPIIIVTGGNKAGDNTTEASTSADYLLRHGLDDKNILRENQSVSTYDSLRDTEVFVRAKGIKKIVLVTDGFHELRAHLIASEVGMDSIESPVKNSPISGTSEWKNFVLETGRVSLGRIIGFRRVSRDSTFGRFVKNK